MKCWIPIKPWDRRLIYPILLWSRWSLTSVWTLPRCDINTIMIFVRISISSKEVHTRQGTQPIPGNITEKQHECCNKMSAMNVIINMFECYVALERVECYQRCSEVHFCWVSLLLWVILLWKFDFFREMWNSKKWCHKNYWTHCFVIMFRVYSYLNDMNA